MSRHQFRMQLGWTGRTSGYTEYSRNHELSGSGKAAAIQGSSDPGFRGDGSRYNPEELLVASLSACHMLWVLHLCADAGIVVTEYTDDASGEMMLEPGGSGHFTEVTLRPRMTITDAARVAEATALHDRAHELCFIASSVNFPVHHATSVTA